MHILYALNYANMHFFGKCAIEHINIINMNINKYN